MCARPGVLTSKLAFHAPPPPPLAPLPFPLPPPTRRPAGEGTKVGTYRPTVRSCLWGVSLCMCRRCGWQGASKSDNCHLPFTSAIHGRLRQSTRGRPRPAVGAHPLPLSLPQPALDRAKYGRSGIWNCLNTHPGDAPPTGWV